MGTKEKQVLIYTASDGTAPFDEWFQSLDISVQARVDARLDRVALGNFGDHKAVGKGVFELRLNFGPGYRIYFGLAGLEIVLLLAGGDKKSQWKDIRTAQYYWDTFKLEKEA